MHTHAGAHAHTLHRVSSVSFLPLSIRNYSFSLAEEHVLKGFVFTHFASDAGAFNYSPFAYHKRAASCSSQPWRRVFPGRQEEGIAFYLTAAAFFPFCQPAKESPQSSYVADTKTVSHFSLPEQ